MNDMWRCIFATLIINNLLIISSISAESEAYVSVETCRIMTAHIPLDDVNYKAGVDVHGRQVKPADLSPAPDFGLKDKISFQMILDAAKEIRDRENSLQQFQDHPGLESNINLGHILITDGNVTLDGKPMSAQHQLQLTEFCKKSRKRP